MEWNGIAIFRRR